MAKSVYKPLISVFIITKNEADRIENVIKAVKKIADEILVIDSGSTDQTVDIAKNLGAKTFYNEWSGYGQQKVFGESLCKNKWILNIDADEEVSEKLAEEILDLFSKNGQDRFVGFKIKIVNKFFNEKQPKKFAYYYNQLRLYNKDYCGFKDSSVHDSVIIKENAGESNHIKRGVNIPLGEGGCTSISECRARGIKNNPIGQLKNIIAHQSFRSFEHWIDKINSYSSMQAQDAFLKGKKVSIFKILLTPSFAFLKAYFIRRYFIYGFNGLIYSCIFAFGRFLKLAKIYQKFKMK